MPGSGRRVDSDALLMVGRAVLAVLMWALSALKVVDFAQGATHSLPSEVLVAAGAFEIVVGCMLCTRWWRLACYGVMMTAAVGGVLHWAGIIDVGGCGCLGSVRLMVHQEVIVGAATAALSAGLVWRGQAVIALQQASGSEVAHLH